MVRHSMKKKSETTEDTGLHYSEPSRWDRSLVLSQDDWPPKEHVSMSRDIFDVATGQRREGRPRMPLACSRWKPGIR